MEVKNIINLAIYLNSISKAAKQYSLVFFELKIFYRATRLSVVPYFTVRGLSIQLKKFKQNTLLKTSLVS